MLCFRPPLPWYCRWDLDLVEEGAPDSALSAAAASWVNPFESLCLSECPFPVKEVGGDRLPSRILSSSVRP